MKEVVITSGKGGTGKTSLAGAFAALGNDAVLTDCDVDAADLYIVLEPEIVREAEFKGGFSPVLDPDRCTGCGLCREHCRFGAIDEELTIDHMECEGCGVCFHICPEEAISLRENVCGRWFVSETRFGPFVHARLGIAEENSGKLVALVRKEAVNIAEARKLELILTDGPPGIGCPLISSVTGADLVVAVAEPTLSGAHDLLRLAGLIKEHFSIPMAVVLNKYDLDTERARHMEKLCRDLGIEVLGRLPFDEAFVESMVAKKTLPEHIEDGPLIEEIKNIWRRVKDLL